MKCATGTVGMFEKPRPVRSKSCVQSVSTPVAVGGIATTTSCAIARIEQDLARAVLEVEAADDAALDDRVVEEPALAADADERDLRAGVVGQAQPEEP